jgi:hypothetical protein
MESSVLWTAIGKFQKERKPIAKDTLNPFFKAKYADLAGIMEIIQPTLTANNLIVIQPVQGHELITKVIHTESAESFESRYPIICKNENNPQDFGSALTYARRYSLCSILGIVADEDDDGNKASDKQKPSDKKDLTKLEKPEPPQYVVDAYAKLLEWVDAKLITDENINANILMTLKHKVKISEMTESEVVKVMAACEKEVNKKQEAQK